MSGIVARKKLKPAPGRLVRYPANPRQVLPEGGAEVVMDTYWTRRLRAGDVVEVTDGDSE